MLTLRKAQIDALGHDMAARFENRVHARLVKTYPDAVADLGEQAVRESIRQGAHRAAAYGITAEYDVARFIDLMYLVSPEFDSRPDLAWVRPTLASPLMTPRVRMDVVHDHLARGTRPRPAKVAHDG